MCGVAKIGVRFLVSISLLALLGTPGCVGNPIPHPQGVEGPVTSPGDFSGSTPVDSASEPSLDGGGELADAITGDASIEMDGAGSEDAGDQGPEEDVNSSD